MSNELRPVLIGEGVYLLSDYGTANAYIVIGEKSCAVIDSGSGVCELRELARELSEGKEVILLLTHAHTDHMGGARQFERAYIHPLERSRLWQGSEWFKRIFLWQCRKNGRLLSSAPPPTRARADSHSLNFLSEAQEFDLGGRRISWFLSPGHTEGSVCYVDSQSKILFSGDAANPIMLIGKNKSANLSLAKASLKKISELCEEYKIYCGHCERPLSQTAVRALIELCEGLERGGGNFAKTQIDTGSEKQRLRVVLSRRL